VTEKVFEFLVGDEGVTLALRPPLAFLPDGARRAERDGAPFLHVLGQGARVKFELPEDVAAALDNPVSLRILEYRMGGEEPVRETDIETIGAS